MRRINTVAMHYKRQRRLGPLASAAHPKALEVRGRFDSSRCVIFAVRCYTLFSFLFDWASWFGVVATIFSAFIAGRAGFAIVVPIFAIR